MSSGVALRMSKMGPTPVCHERYSPYRLLWLMVIRRAAYDYALWKDSKDIRLRKVALGAERWLFGKSDLINSFENICYFFDLPMRWFREYARRLTPDEVRKLEFRERRGRDVLDELILQAPSEDDQDDKAR